MCCQNPNKDLFWRSQIPVSKEHGCCAKPQYYHRIYFVSLFVMSVLLFRRFADCLCLLPSCAHWARQPARMLQPNCWSHSTSLSNISLVGVRREGDGRRFPDGSFEVLRPPFLCRGRRTLLSGGIQSFKPGHLTRGGTPKRSIEIDIWAAVES